MKSDWFSQTRTLEPQSWFQTAPFTFNLRRYSVVPALTIVPAVPNEAKAAEKEKAAKGDGDAAGAAVKEEEQGEKGEGEGNAAAAAEEATATTATEKEKEADGEEKEGDDDKQRRRRREEEEPAAVEEEETPPAAEVPPPLSKAQAWSDTCAGFARAFDAEMRAKRRRVDDFRRGMETREGLSAEEAYLVESMLYEEVKRRDTVGGQLHKVNSVESLKAPGTHTPVP